MSTKELYEDRLHRVNDAIALKEPDRVPIIPMPGTVAYYVDKEGVTAKDSWYNFDAAIQAQVRYHQEFSPDVQMCRFNSGCANELAGTKLIDWPGKPNSILDANSSHQVIEQEFMTADEYPELINDFSGFMLRKFLPRAFPGLEGLSSISFNPASLQFVDNIASFYNPKALVAFQKAAEIAAENQKAATANQKCSAMLTDLGFPPYMSGGAEVPFDIISDFFRGTMGMLMDQLDCPDLVLEACERLVEIELQNLLYLRHAPLPVKRVFIPLHKGMDGFMSPEQYKTLYWAPFQKLLKGIIDLGAVPIIYTEGPYNTRISTIRENLLQFPKGSCVVHFEQGDFVQLKKEFEGIACLSGGMPLNLLAFGKKEDVIDRVKFLVDNVAPGGGYLFNTSGSMDNVKRENLEAMYETAHTYGKK